MRGPIPEHLTRSFAEEILSRLALRVPDHAAVAKAAERGVGPSATEIGMIDRLCDALICDDPRTAADMIDAARQAGVSADAIYTDYISDAARRLGERWVADTASFFDVTLGLSRLHAILREIQPSFLGAETPALDGCTALLAPVPGETHMLGVTIAADYFRRAGWSVDLGTASGLDAIIAAAQRTPYAMLGLSASSRQMIGTLAETIVALRYACPQTAAVVGGYITELEPDIANIVGADASTGDAADAAVSMRRFARA